MKINEYGVLITETYDSLGNLLTQTYDTRMAGPAPTTYHPEALKCVTTFTFDENGELSTISSQPFRNGSPEGEPIAAYLKPQYPSWFVPLNDLIFS